MATSVILICHRCKVEFTGSKKCVGRRGGDDFTVKSTGFTLHLKAQNWTNACMVFYEQNSIPTDDFASSMVGPLLNTTPTMPPPLPDVYDAPMELDGSLHSLSSAEEDPTQAYGAD